MTGKNPQPTNQNSDFISGVVEFLLSGIAITFEVMLRKNFGERYFTPAKFLIGLFSFWFFSFLLTSQFRLSDFSAFYSTSDLTFNLTRGDILPNFSIYVFLAYSLAYIFLGLAELRQSFSRNRNGDPWHSYFNGESRVRFLDTITEMLGLRRMLGQHIIANHIVQIYIEPLFFFGLGLVLLFVLPSVGYWFIFGSFIVFLRGAMIYGRLKAHFLDMSDSKIESKHMSMAFKGGVSPHETAGFTPLAIRPSGLQIPVDTEEAYKTVFRDNPALAEMMQMAKAAEKTTENTEPPAKQSKSRKIAIKYDVPPTN